MHLWCFIKYSDVFNCCLFRYLPQTFGICNNWKNEIKRVDERVKPKEVNFPKISFDLIWKLWLTCAGLSADTGHMQTTRIASYINHNTGPRERAWHTANHLTSWSELMISQPNAHAVIRVLSQSAAVTDPTIRSFTVPKRIWTVRRKKIRTDPPPAGLVC